MSNPALVEARLVAQGLARPAANSPAEVVTALGAMQGQDLPGVLSSIALRLGPETGGSVGGGPDSGGAGSGSATSTPGCDRLDRVIDAFNTGQIVRGYPMRGTVFALPAADAAWVTELCAGPQRRAQAKRWQNLGITPAQVERAREIFAAEAAKAAAAGVSRRRLAEVWEEAGVLGESGSAYSLISGMVIDGLAVYGPLEGRHHLVVPAADWLPEKSGLEGRFNGDAVAATAELLRRYLSSHGPASLRDFQWWTKLPQKLIKPAFALIADDFVPAPTELLGRAKGTHTKGTHTRQAQTSGARVAGTAAGKATAASAAKGVVDLDVAWARVGLPDEVRRQARDAHGTYLLPGFDEITLGYQDRLAFMTADHHHLLVPGNNGMFRKTVVRGGKFLGVWTAPRGGKKAADKGTTAGNAGAAGRRLELEEFAPLSQAALRDIQRAFKRFPHTD